MTTPDKGTSPMQLVFRSDPFAVRDALSQSRLAWDKWGVTPETCGTAEQVLAEVLNNVVEHAHQEDPNGAVHLTCHNLDGGLKIEVRDDGRPMPGLALPKGHLDDLPDAMDDLPEGGFGWFMIHMLTQDLHYERVGGWNCVRFMIEAQSEPSQ